ncbi:MAG TPA: type II secretion system F family protein [Phycisphaerae bacterium]|nr:type II secretion system F family protein [Phycisphaerae bacterium]
MILPPAALAQAGDGRFFGAIVAVAIFLGMAGVILFGWDPFRRLVLRMEGYYDRVLRRQLLLDVNPRTVTMLGLGAILLFALIAYSLIQHVLSGLIGAAFGAVLAPLSVRFLRARRLYKLEDQLVDGIQTLSSGVRAGLNLVQAMGLLATNGVKPISEEFGHLHREYEHGISLEQAMHNAAGRIGSSNYRLLFAALLTHRERGGDLGETLDRIADSIREIHRLEKKIETLTAPGRTAARWMGAMPAVIIAILYFIDPSGVMMLFTEDFGKLILSGIVALNVVGFLWIRRIVSIDV